MRVLTLVEKGVFSYQCATRAGLCGVWASIRLWNWTVSQGVSWVPALISWLMFTVDYCWVHLAYLHQTFHHCASTKTQQTFQPELLPPCSSVMKVFECLGTPSSTHYRPLTSKEDSFSHVLQTTYTHMDSMYGNYKRLLLKKTIARHSIP